MIRSVAETQSTNDDMAALAKAGAADGCWLWAEHQTAGRGRQGRHWSPAPGNLYASTLVRICPGDPSAPSLALVAAVALDAALLPLTGPDRLRIKWPNDLMLDGAKLSGILLEREGDAVIVGFGVNLAQAPHIPDRATISLGEAGLQVPAPGELVVTLADRFAEYLDLWRAQGMSAIADHWAKRSFPLGTMMRAWLPDGNACEGMFDGMAPDGALRLRRASGSVETIHAGDVFLI